MLLTEYTNERAMRLLHMNIPDRQSPVRMKFPWFEITDSTTGDSILTERHSHPFFEIHLIFSGSVTYQYEEETVVLQSGQALLLPPSLPHRYVRTDIPFCKASLTFFADSAVDSALLLPVRQAMLLSYEDDIAQSVDFILRQCENSDLFSPSLISGRLLEILASLRRTSGVQAYSPHQRASHPHFVAAKNYIYENRDRIISCDEVAKACYLSGKQLNRIFKHCTGQTLSTYLVDLRMSDAKGFLLDSEYSIKEIAYALGFESSGSFIAFFKRHCGVSPGIYRKNCAKKQ